MRRLTTPTQGATGLSGARFAGGFFSAHPSILFQYTGCKMNVFVRSAFLSIASSVSIHAFAASPVVHLSCSNMAGDGGYLVEFSVDARSVKVTENNIAGARVVADLHCPPHPTPPCCDQIASSVCSLPSSAYEVELRTGGISGTRRVLLSRGIQQLANISCEYRP